MPKASPNLPCSLDPLEHMSLWTISGRTYADDYDRVSAIWSVSKDIAVLTFKQDVLGLSAEAANAPTSEKVCPPCYLVAVEKIGTVVEGQFVLERSMLPSSCKCGGGQRLR